MSNESNTTPAETLVSLGRDWASYGLKLAQLALEQSAGTLGKVATALDGIRAQVDATAKPATPPPAAPEGRASATQAPL